MAPVDFDNPGKAVIKPMRLAHVVLRTNKFEEMKRFYKDFLGAEACFENEAVSFMSYDEEHHRIALAYVPGTADKVVTSCGLEVRVEVYFIQCYPAQVPLAETVY